MNYFAHSYVVESFTKLQDKWTKSVFFCIWGDEHDQNNLSFSHVLLIFYASICCQKNVKLLFRERKKFAILYTCPAHFSDGCCVVVGEVILQIMW